MAADIAFVNLDLAAKDRLAFALERVRDDLAQAMKVERGTVAMHPHQAGGRPRCRARNEMLLETELFVLRNTALSHAILDNSNYVI